MKLKWKIFSSALKLIEFINKNGIKQEQIQSIHLKNSDFYELFYWNDK